MKEIKQRDKKINKQITNFMKTLLMSRGINTTLLSYFRERNLGNNEF